jgi:ribosomal protein S18 acetylase RimI-like enzyme
LPQPLPKRNDYNNNLKIGALLANFSTRIMKVEDYEVVYGLWSGIQGMGMRSLDDSQAGIAKFLIRNPNTCFVAEQEGQIVGVILSGHDGRRGYIYHAAVLPYLRGQGIGKELLGHAIGALKAEGIHKAGLLVFASNEIGNVFWESQGWERRTDVYYRNKSLNEENKNIKCL